MSKAIAVAKPSIESEGAESHKPSPHATKSRKQKLIDAPRQSKHLPTRRPPSMIFSHGRLVSSRLSRRSHPDCRATLAAVPPTSSLVEFMFYRGFGHRFGYPLHN